MLRSLHVTVALLRATTPEQVGLAASVLHNASPALRAALTANRAARLAFDSISDFRGKVRRAAVRCDAVGCGEVRWDVVW